MMEVEDEDMDSLASHLRRIREKQEREKEEREKKQLEKERRELEKRKGIMMLLVLVLLHPQLLPLKLDIT